MKSIILRYSTLAGLLGAVAWLVSSPSWEPIVVSVGLLGTFIATDKTDKRPLPNSAIGIGVIHDPLTDENLRDHLSSSRDIKVLKTWFPETPEIEAGFESAIQNGAKVRLLLCKPGCVILEQRSLGAGEHASTGSRKVYRTVERVYRLVTNTSHPDVQIACYESWPGCPVIWYDGEILMGFYFRGGSSPKWPWISVGKGSKLANILENQFNDLWNHLDTQRPDTRTEKLDTPEKMAKWLEDNKQWRAE